MKAIILAAGYATRLYPLTKDKPKPLLDVAEKPIIEWIIGKIEEIPEIDEIFVVTNKKFFGHFLDWRANFSSQKTVTIVNDMTTSNEDRLGSLGDIRYVVHNLKVKDDILVVAGDNLFSFSLEKIMKNYREHKKPMVALYDVKDMELAKLYGIVSINEEGKIIHFEEKPQEPKSTLSSTGIYFYPQETIELLETFLREGGKQDKAGDFLEWLYTRETIYGHVTDKPWYDIGSLEQLEKAREDYKG